MTLSGPTHSREELIARVEAARSVGGRVALVPTMGALHDGHAALIRRARKEVGDDGVVVASIFVNPLQFGPDEDLDRYPRDLEADMELCIAEGVDIVFAPDVSTMYPTGMPHRAADGRALAPAVTVDPGPIADILEGAQRPGHFRGVLTVVAKLFGLVRPDLAVFGEKDYQQLALVQRMVDDLCLGVEIVAITTEREPDGLARSSRNRYLSGQDREGALTLVRALQAADRAATDGPRAAERAGRAVLDASPSVDADYFVVLGTDLAELPDVVAPGTAARALVAARVGSTRLIDNRQLVVGDAQGPGSN